MSGATAAARAALATLLRADPVLRATLNGVFDGPAVRATPPFAEIGEATSGDWGTKDRVGRELRLAVILRDATETSARIAALAAAVEAAVPGLPRDLVGWRVASVAFLRSRIAGEGPGRWIAAVEFRVRMLASG
ncbi:MAG: DUF3168 domain-containing protein ['Waltheria sp.' little leaf phytoplasma]|nr:DUF3168 domain-containing protein ['Waltheria sp.' little leaf phytoplasma]